MKLWKRVLSMILALCLMSTALPAVPALAAETGQGEETVQADYAVTDLTVRGTAATVELTAPGNCTLVVALYTEQGAMISTVMEPVTGDAAPQTIPVTIDPKENTVFTAKAFLLDGESYAPLGEPDFARGESWGTPEGMRELAAESVSYDEGAGVHYVKDIILVFFTLDAAISDIQEAVKGIGGQIVGRDDLLNLYQIQVEADSLEEIRVLADQLEDQQDCVAHATFDTVSLNQYASVTALPNDPWNGDASATDWKDADVDGSNWWVEAVEGQAAWTAARSFAPIPVGVMDSSVDQTHEDLKDQVAFVNKAALKRNDSAAAGHGTHVAGIIGAAPDNGVGITGLAQNAELVFSSNPECTDSLVYAGISDLVEAGAKVINLSISNSEDLPGAKLVYSQETLEEWAIGISTSLAVLLAQDLDFIVVQSSGNGNGNHVAVDAIQGGWLACITEDTPEPYVASEWDSDRAVTLQDVMDRTIVVGNADRVFGGYRCHSSSNYGSQVDLCAPGTNIYSTLPGGYGLSSGTSMSAPIVSAVCALTWGAQKGLTGAEVRHIVCSATNQQVDSHPDTGMAATYPMVNAKLSVEKALEYVRVTTSESPKTYPVTVRVKHADGTPASGVEVGVIGLGTSVKTSVDGTTVLFLPEGTYGISAVISNGADCSAENTRRVTGEYADQTVAVSRRTEVNLTLAESYFVWALDGTHLTINGYGPMPDFAAYPPWGTAITSAAINGVSSIGSNAFYSCSNLTDVDIDTSVKTIGPRAFRGCTGLTKVQLPEGLLSIGEWAFYSCSGLRSVDFPRGVTSIGPYAFYECTALAGDLILDCLAALGEKAFYNCRSLTSITLSGSLRNIPSYVFYLCKGLETVRIPESVTAISEYAFYECTALTEINIPCGVTSIGGRAFTNCTNLERVSLPDSLISIGDWAYSGCNGLTEVSVPAGATELGYAIFAYCTGLRSAKIQDGVSDVSEMLFYGCLNLASVDLPDSITKISSRAFGDCKALTGISIPSSVTFLGAGAFANCTTLSSIVLPNSVRELGEYVFEGCTNLTTAVLSTELTSIPGRTFAKCESLRYVTLPKEITSIQNSAFEFCTSLSSITLPDHLTELGEKSFYGCSSLLRVDIPEGVERIVGEYIGGDMGNGPFGECTSLETVTIPKTVTSIGDQAFRGCESLKDVYFAGAEEQWENGSFGTAFDGRYSVGIPTIHFGA